ncbi:hypothetical protein RB213_014931 [Colletotrichum asianum]
MKPDLRKAWTVTPGRNLRLLPVGPEYVALRGI